MIDLTGKTALVTGGSRGIGRAIVLRLAQQGADIAFMDRGAPETAAQTKADVEAIGRRAIFFAGDVTDPEACTAFVQAAIEAFGKVDILVNNAGITRDDLVMRMGIDEWKMVLEVNLFGAFYCTKAVLRPMLKARAGRIINMSSVSGQAGQAGQANYSSSKAGLIGLTKAVAREVASRGITANAVAPGLHRHRADAGPARGAAGPDPEADAAGPLRDRGRHRQRRGLPRLGRGGLHHGPGARRRRRPGDDVAVPFTVEATAIPEVLVVRPRLFGDERGWFTEVLQADAFAELGLGLPTSFVQVNQSRSARGVVRGLHFQWDPPQAKLMRVVRGRAFMVAVDIRPGSPTLGQVVTVEGSEDEPVLFWAPASFARGFCALADVTEIEYFCTADVQPALRVRHPLGRPGAGDRVAGGGAALSPKDAAAGTLADWLARPEAALFAFA